MGNVQVGGKVPKGAIRSRIERPFAGVIAGLSINRLRVLDLAAERDQQITMRGDVQLVTGVLDRNDLQTRMQQVRFLNKRQFIKIIWFHEKEMQDAWWEFVMKFLYAIFKLWVSLRFTLNSRSINCIIFHLPNWFSAHIMKFFRFSFSALRHKQINNLFNHISSASSDVTNIFSAIFGPIMWVLVFRVSLRFHFLPSAFLCPRKWYNGPISLFLLFTWSHWKKAEQRTDSKQKEITLKSFSFISLSFWERND